MAVDHQVGEDTEDPTVMDLQEYARGEHVMVWANWRVLQNWKTMTRKQLSRTHARVQCFVPMSLEPWGDLNAVKRQGCHGKQVHVGATRVDRQSSPQCFCQLPCQRRCCRDAIPGKWRFRFDEPPTFRPSKRNVRHLQAKREALSCEMRITVFVSFV